MKTGQKPTMQYVILDVIQSTDMFENFVDTSTLEYGVNLLYGYSLPRYSWKTGLKFTNIKLAF